VNAEIVLIDKIKEFLTASSVKFEPRSCAIKMTESELQMLEKKYGIKLS
jgi:hypothetical protein